jgi:hypothetical protein
MSLADKLGSASERAKNLKCKIGALISGDALSKKDKENLEAALDVPMSDPGRIPNSTMGALLREEGYDISNSAVDRHRARSCPCYRKAAK